MVVASPNDGSSTIKLPIDDAGERTIIEACLLWAHELRDVLRIRLAWADTTQPEWSNPISKASAASRLKWTKPRLKKQCDPKAAPGFKKKFLIRLDRLTREQREKFRDVDPY
jgi:hypothetical protein